MRPARLRGLRGGAPGPDARGVVVWGCVLAWASTAFVLGFLYPPYQILMGYLVGLLGAGVLLSEGGLGPNAPLRGLRLTAMAVAGVVAVVATAAFALGSWEAIRAVAGTVYPGTRRLLGGVLTAWQLLNPYFTPFLNELILWNPSAGLDNSCEAGAFYYVFPATLACLAYEWIAHRRRPGPIEVASGAYIAFFCLYAFVGLPSIVERVLLLDRVGSRRVLLGLGVAEMFLLVSFLARRAPPFSRAGVAIRLALAAAWALALAPAGGPLVPLLGAHGTVRTAIAVLLAFAWGAAVLLRARVGLAAFAVASTIVALPVNPVARGGTEWIRDNELSRKVRELDLASGGRSRWIVYDDLNLPDLFRAVGVRAVNGVHYYPQRELWSRLDLGPELRDLTNRYAHVVFLLPENRTEPRVDTPTGDVVEVWLHPDHPAFARLGVDHVVYAGPDPERFARASRLEWEASVGDKHFFRVMPRGPTPLAPATPSGYF